MGLLSLEQSQVAYRADFVVHGVLVLALAAGLLLAPASDVWQIAALVLLGWLGWSLLEYGLHRFVLHGLPPFRRWHALHHARPAALIGTPTVLSASLVAGLVLLPVSWLGHWWQAAALSLGLLLGYLGYALAHHAIHHWRAEHAWLQQRKRWHALHHQAGGPPRCYGVTSGFWDHVFRTAR